MRSRKTIVILLLVTIVGVVGLTFAFFINKTIIENEFITNVYGTSVTKVFASPDNWIPGTTTPKTLVVTNSGNVDEAVRVEVIESWVSENGDSLPLKQNGNDAAIINWANTSDWTHVTENGKNYYYYNYKLAPTKSTSTLLDSVTFNLLVSNNSSCATEVSNREKDIVCAPSGDGYDGATYTLTFKIETVQYNKYVSAWNTGNTVTIAEERPVFVGTQFLINNATNASGASYNPVTKGKMFVFNQAVTSQTSSLTDYRYIGDAPNNYIYFNCDDISNQSASTCEVWRILGVFDVDDGTGNVEQRIKLVRSSDFSTGMYWNNGSNNNDWTNASLKSFLNGDYYNRTGSAATYGLKASARNMIGDAKYYLGAVSWDSTNSNYGGTSKIYGEERGNVLCGSCGSDTTKLAWTGKVGLMYPSDVYMAYGNGVNATCYDNPRECYSSDSNAQTGWVFNSNIQDGQSSLQHTWLLSSSTISSNYILYVYYIGALDATGPSSYNLWVRPVVYLNADVKISDGDGTSGNPYKLQ